MTETQVEKTMAELKEGLPHGGQRELARRLGCLPDKISKAFDGFVRDLEFMSRLQAESHKLIEEERLKKLNPSQSTD